MENEVQQIYEKFATEDGKYYEITSYGNNCYAIRARRQARTDSKGGCGYIKYISILHFKAGKANYRSFTQGYAEDAVTR